ncbi:MAG: hypothetical protein AB7E61_07225 [Acholeplasmataceae bacterium]
MILGKIKIEALRLMFAGYNQDYEVDDLETLTTDDNYGTYLKAMNGSINRCFDRLRSLAKQPKKSLTLEFDPDVDEDFNLEYDLDDEAFASVDKIVRIVWRDLYGNVIRNFEYELEGRTLIIQNMQEAGTYKLIYLEKLPFIDDLADTEDLTIDDELARIIPYWIKGELYEEDEPSVAAQSRQLFEYYLSNLYVEEEIVQTKVKDVYGY